MSTLTRAVGTLSFLAAATVQAQRPGIPPSPGGRPAFGMMVGVPGGGGASPVSATADFLLAHTGDLALTDAQVVRLAAISRRMEARRKAFIARMDSARDARPTSGDSARSPGRGRRLDGPSTAEMQQARDRMHADVREAIAVLTPDQQATAWMMIAADPPLGGRLQGPMGSRPGRPQDSEQHADRGPISRPPAPRDVPRRPEGDMRTEP
jgi:LTXXQ motif family protein